MDISTANSAGLAEMIGGVSLKQQHATSVLKLSNDQIKQDGANALKLVQSAALPEPPQPQGPLGHHIDVRA